MKLGPTAPPRFVRSTIAEVRMRFATARKASLSARWLDAVLVRGESYNIVGLHQDQKVYWALFRAGTPDIVGGGWFTFMARPRLLVENRAALLSSFVGLGIYPQVLRALRSAYKRPLESDLHLSAANRRAWSKVGQPTNRDRAFRINPVVCHIRLAVADQIRQAWINTERRLPPKG